ncbi:hypothetical protein FISHEDRAFT_62691 [Fistulina hepatica ATCC 64428]|nr:hypothetical protein FISHEDRAFT_62691 [Fistulina hepatica ATCC 64428]
MSPRNPPSTIATRSTSAPYPRRQSAQPKSSRQQFSACGACRMRRVRCDLKDLSISSANQPACSNCKERGLKCVDEFADVKAVKLLRRGRRLQQVEAIYGKATDVDLPSPMGATKLQISIPTLQPEFFDSQFWRLFCMQRPIIDSNEYTTRLLAQRKSNCQLNPETHLLSMVVVVWAASVGVNEHGVVDNVAAAAASESNRRFPRRASGNQRGSSHDELDPLRQTRKTRTAAMIRELLLYIDVHGIIRKPSWEGVAALLLLVPLLEDSPPLERFAVQEAALSQIRALCTLGTGEAAAPCDESVTRARVLCYAILQEGITSGLKGGRLLLDEDDIEAFQATSSNFGSGRNSPFSSSYPPGPFSQLAMATQLSQPTPGCIATSHLFAIPLRLGTVCRRLYHALTCTAAMKRAESGDGVDAEAMRDVWEGLDRCWDDFEALKRSGSLSSEENIFDVHRFVGSWQIFIFECHNIIRESLKQFATCSLQASPVSPATHVSPAQLHDIATRKCLDLLPNVLGIIKMHVSPGDNRLQGTGLFTWDAGLVRDGCFFAGVLVASVKDRVIEFAHESPHGSGLFKQEEAEPSLFPQSHEIEEGVVLCLAALSEMQWTLSKSEEREETIRLIWESRKAGIQQHQATVGVPAHHNPDLGELEYPACGVAQFSDVSFGSKVLESPGGARLVSVGPPHRPQPPPLILPHSQHGTGGLPSAPNTAISHDGSSAAGWPSYSPPGTATSGTNTASTGLSVGGSPIFPSPAAISVGGTTISTGAQGSFKPEDDPTAVAGLPFYHGAGSELDHFAFSSGGAPVMASVVDAVAVFEPRGPHNHSPYLDGVFVPAGTSPLMGHTVGGTETAGNCSPFGEDVPAFFH